MRGSKAEETHVDERQNRINNINYSLPDTTSLLREVNVLIYDVTRKYELIIADIKKDHERQVSELKSQIELYEAEKYTAVRFRKTKHRTRQFIIRLIKKVLRFSFRIIKSCIIKMGWKDRVRNSALFIKIMDARITEKIKRRLSSE
ncbi:hypothetical protein PAT3040_02587 [Paenibacillus agaridevorans]|uniref:Uncharacterized protein n=1 Tax=Paenibacillus agaridevorans TaxID=171404 RepID=A0A2R5EMY0_9BACL|nr:hypothetical protein [Paenibacillus agaridevorans]GBG08020.1 hypothetical protein PAT3040_02587 [Paenibacillus agaridevorans]